MTKPMLPVWVLLPFSLTLACGGPEPSPTFVDNAQAGLPAATAVSSIENVTVTTNPTAPLTLMAKLAYVEDRFSNISSPVQGRVLDIRVKLGDSVKAGEVLLVMDSSDIAQASTDYVKEMAELELATRNCELVKDLYEARALSLKEYKQAENDLRRERAEFQQAKERLLSLSVPAAALEQLSGHTTSLFELKSPLTGTVVARTVTPGQLVRNDANQVLFTVADLNTLQVVADLYEKDLAVPAVGQQAHVRVDAYPDIEFPATIGAIGDVVDATTRTITVRAWVHNQARHLKPDMFARLTLPVEGKESMVIPAEAVTNAGPHRLVYVEIAPGHYDKRPVTVERLDQGHVRVSAGLTPGERIAKSAAQVKAVGF